MAYNKQNPDAGILALASLTDLPKQPVTLRKNTYFLSTQINQIKAAQKTPVVDSSLPIQVVRRNLGNGTFQFRVQFIAPTPAQDPNYQTTTAVLQSPTGTIRLAAAGGAGPIVFNAPQSTAPGSVALQQNNSNGTSEVGLGKGNSRPLNQGF
jgi:hypothetical protein